MNKESKNHSKPVKRFPFTLILTVFLTCFGSSFLYGYNIAILNLPSDKIKCFINTTILSIPCADAYNSESGTFNSTVIKNVKQGNIDADFIYAQTSTAFVVAGIIGAFSTGWIADFIGRRNGLLFNHSFVIVGAIIIGLTVKTGQPALLFVGRFLTGINAGVTVGLASIYLTELAPKAYRGAIGACHTLAATIGILFGYIMTMTQTLNTSTLWPLACASIIIPAVISLIFLPFCPESPRFIFLKRSNEEVARKEFMRINQIEDVNIFINDLKEEVESAKNQLKFKFTRLFTDKDLRMPMLIACLIQIMQQLSGINAVISYSSLILDVAGISKTYNQYFVIGIGLINVICTISALPLLEKLGRRTLLLWPSVIVAISLLCLTVTVNLVNEMILSPETKKIIGGLSAFLIMVFVFGYALGLGPVPVLIVAEIFRQEPRGVAYSVSQAVQWLANLIVLFSFPSLNKAIGGYSFLIFLAIVIICLIFFFFFMPETKNRTTDEIALDLTRFCGRISAREKNSILIE